MLMICNYEEIPKGRTLFFILSLETHCCPFCGGKLNVKDYRKRKWRTIYGKTITYLLRRMRCCNCGKLHTELPDKLLPYKRYEADAVEALISGKGAACVASMRTKKRWLHWFESLWKLFLLMFIRSMKAKSVGMLDNTSKKGHKKSGWLTAAVSKIINSEKKAHLICVCKKQPFSYPQCI